MQAKIAHDKRAGSPYDRGSADKYYGREFEPHYFIGETYRTEKITRENMNAEEIAAYAAGYAEEMDAKEWGNDQPNNDDEEENGNS